MFASACNSENRTWERKEPSNRSLGQDSKYTWPINKKSSVEKEPWGLKMHFNLNFYPAL